MDINHISQPTWNTCVSAVAAMLLNKNVQSVVDEFHDDYHAGKIDLSDYLTSNGIKLNKCYTDHRGVEWGNLYVVVVPSLNRLGHTHCVIIDMRSVNDDNCYYEKVYDPCKGRDGCKYYDVVRDSDNKVIPDEACGVIPDTNGLGHTLSFAIPEYEIILD